MESQGMTNYPYELGHPQESPQDVWSNDLPLVGYRSCNWSFRQKKKGIKLTLAPKSQRALVICKFPIDQGIEKLPGSCSLEDELRCRTALQISPIESIVTSSSLPFLERSSLKNFK